QARGVLRSHGLFVDRKPTKPLADIPPPENRLVALRVSKMPPYQPAENVVERRYRLLETRALIRFEHPAQMRLVDAVLGHLACDEKFEPTVVIEIQAVPGENGEHLRGR